MSSFYVYIPPSNQRDNSVEDFRLIKDGKSKLGLIFPFIFLIWNRLWLPFIIYVALMCVIWGLFSLNPNPAFSYLSLLLNLYFFLEGNQLLANRLEREGWKLADIVVGENKTEASLRFLSYYKNDTSRYAKVIKPVTQHQQRKPFLKPSPAAGLFPE